MAQTDIRDDIRADMGFRGGLAFDLVHFGSFQAARGGCDRYSGRFDIKYEKWHDMDSSGTPRTQDSTLKMGVTDCRVGPEG